jgi:hypothetical protein
MAKTVQEALQQGEIYTDEEKYTFLKLPIASIQKASSAIATCSSSRTFRGLLFDKDEITLMIAEKEYEAQKNSGLLHGARNRRGKVSVSAHHL